MIEKAQAQGAKLLAGGNVPQGLNDGFFVEPTVLGDVDPASELGQVEVFGPVLSLMRFHDEEEAVKIANATEYGLAAYLFTNDAATHPSIGVAPRGWRRLRQWRVTGRWVRSPLWRCRHLWLRPGGRPGRVV